jgi:hypothetical protein
MGFPSVLVAIVKLFDKTLKEILTENLLNLFGNPEDRPGPSAHLPRGKARCRDRDGAWQVSQQLALKK